MISHAHSDRRSAELLVYRIYRENWWWSSSPLWILYLDVAASELQGGMGYLAYCFIYGPVDISDGYERPRIRSSTKIALLRFDLCVVKRCYKMRHFSGFTRLNILRGDKYMYIFWIQFFIPVNFRIIEALAFRWSHISISPTITSAINSRFLKVSDI